MATPRKHWFRVADSIRDEPWSNDQLAFMVRLMAAMNTRWARNGLDGKSACSIELNSTDLMAISGKHRADVARTSAERLADIAEISVSHRGDVTLIAWPKYSEFQGLVTRDSPESRPLRKTPPPPPPPPPPQNQKKDAAARSCVCPDRLTDHAMGLMLDWASPRGITIDQVEYAWERVRDWSRSKRLKRTDWAATLRNAISDGWALKGYGTIPAETPAQAKERQLRDAMREAFVRMTDDDDQPELLT